MKRFNPLAWLGTHWPPLVLAIFAVITHRVWFQPGSVLSYSDWLYWTSHGVQEIIRTWGAWSGSGGLGSANLQPHFIVFEGPWNILHWFGIGYDTALKLTVLIPLAFLSFLSPYVFAKRLTGDRLAAFAGALFYGTVTYFIARQTAHLTVSFVIAATPLMLWQLDRAAESTGYRRWAGLALLFTFAAGYEMRIGLIAAALLLAYGLGFRFADLRQRWKGVLACLGLALALNLYWILPTFGGAAQAISKVANRGLFGDILLSLPRALTAYDWSWTGGYLNNSFIPQPLHLYLWLIPAVAIAALYIPGKANRKAGFFALIALAGVLLTKQSDEPFAGLYGWMYANLPFFNLFREASKFYLVTMIGYLGLISLAIQAAFAWRRQAGYLLVACVAFVALYNVRPLLNQSIGTLFVTRHIPAEYDALSAYLDADTTFGRVLWVPGIVQWGEYNSTHPRLSLADLSSAAWTPTGELPANQSSQEARLTDPLRRTYGANLLDQSSVRYVILPLQDAANDNDVYRTYGPRDDYASILASLPYLHRLNVPGTGDLVIYENTDFLPHLYLTDSQVGIDGSPQATPVASTQQVTSSQFTVTLHHLTGPTYLQFAETYSPAWQVAAGTPNLITNPPPLTNTASEKTAVGLNSFRLDPASIRATAPASSYAVNSDGSIDLTLTVFYQTQVLFYRGLAITGLALVGCLCLMLPIRRRRHV